MMGLSYILYVIRAVVRFGLSAVELIMFISVILSWVAPTADGPFISFINSVTEFFVAPVRAFMDRFEFARRSPIDLSFLVTYLLIIILSMLF